MCPLLYLSAVFKSTAAATTTTTSTTTATSTTSTSTVVPVQDWATVISDSALSFTKLNTTVQRKGSVSCYPGAFAKLPAAHCSFRVKLEAAPRGNNWVSFGLTKKGMASSSTDGLGQSSNSWGFADNRDTGNNDLPQVYASGESVSKLPRKLQDGDVLCAEANVAAGWCEIRFNDNQYKHRFTIPVGSKEDYWFGMTFANDHMVTILPTLDAYTSPAGAASAPAPSGSPFKALPSTGTRNSSSIAVFHYRYIAFAPNVILLAISFLSLVWSTDISNTHLSYSNNHSTAKRPGGASCYPAAFAKLNSVRASFQVRLDAAPRDSNWVSFGLAKRGMAVDSSDGMGRTTNTWGIADDRNSTSTAMPVAAASKTTISTLPRKLKQGDVLSGEVDLLAGWFEVRLNQSEFSHRFTIPVGSKEDYWFGMTFANDHQATILMAEPPAAQPAASKPPSEAAGKCAPHSLLTVANVG
jgi:hypothetical protein